MNVYRILKNIALTLFLIIPAGIYAQGSIEGIVLDAKTGESLVGVNVVIEGTLKGVVTDFEGKYSITNLQPGKYNLKFSYVSYNTTISENINVERNKTSLVNIKLDEASISLESVVVTATKRSNTEMSMISSIKTSNIVVSGISAQTISRSQDKDASEVVKRIPGITILEDKFIVVRGLNQRYNNVWLNNAATPSSETDVKAFSFDVIPSSMIDNILVYKTAAPELPAEATGGFIKIFTKNMPDKNFLNIEYGIGYKENTTFKNFEQNQGGKFDWLGIDDGTRALPSGFPSNLANVSGSESNKYSKLLNKNWTTTGTNAIPNQKIGITMGRRFTVGKINVGNITTVNYNNSFETLHKTNNNYKIYDYANDKSNPNFTYKDDVYSNDVKLSVLHNWAFYLGKGDKIEFRNLFNQIGLKRSSFRTGHEYYSGEDIMQNENRFMSRSIYSGQLGGEHSFNEGITKLDWVTGYSYANRLEPDRKVLTYQYDENKALYKISLKEGSAVDPKLAGRLFLKNIENIYLGCTNLEHKFNLLGIKPSVKTGIYAEYKDRVFNVRNIGYLKGANFDETTSDMLYLPANELFTDNNFDYLNKLKLSETTDASDEYEASNFLTAAYVGLNIPITSYINFYGGVRAEQNQLKLTGHKKGDLLENPTNVNNTKLELFPSANITYNFTEKTLVRLAYGRTINRPEFREVSPFNFYDFNSSASIYGNSDLKDALIDNIDFRFENYPSAGETYSIAFFYKKFSNPIEMVYAEGGSGLAYTFQNAQKAENMGIEVEIRKALDEISLKNFSVVANGSLIYSKVFFSEESKKTQKDRALQGQSPYIANVGLYYNNEKNGFDASILYNIIGKRTLIAGRVYQSANETIPDVYEMPRNVLDLTLSKKINKIIELKFGIKDILNENKHQQQTFEFTDQNGVKQERTLPTLDYNPGRTISLGVVVKL